MVKPCFLVVGPNVVLFYACKVMVATVRCEEIANEKLHHLATDEVCFCSLLTYFSFFSLSDLDVL